MVLVGWYGYKYLEKVTPQQVCVCVGGVEVDERTTQVDVRRSAREREKKKVAKGGERPWIRSWIANTLLRWSEIEIEIGEASVP